MARQQKTSHGSSGNHVSSDDDIRALAYELYCENGYQHGHDLEYWLEAERQLSGRGKAPRQKAA
jgi:hypothetical protein